MMDLVSNEMAKILQRGLQGSETNAIKWLFADLCG
jgi:hypothetical protein